LGVDTDESVTNFIQSKIVYHCKQEAIIEKKLPTSLNSTKTAFPQMGCVLTPP